ncbi:FGGY-family carbohydrate kinase, partial [bacterium]|nr:FGGY-family carbohydrate kinase [bacterium]
MKPICLGIDLGTTVLKAAAFDAATGRELGRAQRRLPLIATPDGGREQDPHLIDRALGAVCRELRRRVGRRWLRIAGVGLASQGGSFCIVDRVTGRPHTPFRLWNDMRPLRHLSEVARRKPAAYWRRLAMFDGPGWGLARMIWLRRRAPRLFRPQNLYVGAGEYAYFRLTGQWRQDPGNALQIGCYNVRRAALDPEPLRLVNVPASFVAPLRDGHRPLPAGADAARRYGIARGTPVVGPYLDHEAGYLSAVGVSRHPLQCSLGTAWVGNFVLPPDARWRSPFQLVMPALDGPGWLIVRPLLTGNVTWDWALTTFVHRNQQRALDRAADIFARRLLPPRGLTALPWLNLPNPLLPDALGAAAIYGLSPATTPADLLRAVAAGMAFDLVRSFARIRDQRCIDSVVLGGGAGKGRNFQQLLAALFAPVPVYVTQDQDLTGPRGAVYAFSRAAAAGPARRV